MPSLRDCYRGEYFLRGEGGPRSKYAEAVGPSEWCGGEKVIPLTLDSAQKWAEEYLDADEYEKIFGEIVEEETGKRTVTFSLPDGVIELIKKLPLVSR